MYDLVLKGGRVIDPSQELDTTADVAFSKGKVAAVGKDLKASAKGETRDVSGKIVVPGILDLHTHIYHLGTSLGVDPVQTAKDGGSTTLIDAGSAGPGNYPGFLKHVIEPCPVRILAYLNISFAGIPYFSKTTMVGECQDIRLLDVNECRRVAAENRDTIVGIKVRVGRGAGGTSGHMPLDMAVEVADDLGLPVMCHLDHPPPSRREVLDRMRPGDVLTHCFRPFPNAPIDGAGRVRSEINEARARGIFFDVGHGAGSFGFKTGREMIDNGFYPDCISSDIHCLSIEHTMLDNMITLSKFLCLGMPLNEVIRAATVNPAKAIRRADLGTLKVGAAGDAVVLDHRKGKFEYADVLGETLVGKHRLVNAGMVVGGKWWFDGIAKPGRTR
ncbi:MAG: amidohydrolase/deacetylase family metallohydrolase [Alphaproteobacteria bacterium]|nr:amidohydrolase/deacetylase family metallohydrolase [Alphaproteobacteria bacterium]